MNTKRKVGIIATFALLSLIIIGLTIGLVLVAQEANIGNQITIKYTAKNVDADVIISAKNYSSENDNTGSTIKIKDIGDTATLEFTYDQDKAESNLEFEVIELSATGKAVFTFDITNTATNDKILKAHITATDLASDDNIILSIGTNLSSTTELTEDNNTDTIEIGEGQDSTTIYVTVEVDDHNIDIDNFKFNLDFVLSYDE